MSSFDACIFVGVSTHVLISYIGSTFLFSFILMNMKMNIFLPVLFLVSLVIAEPPVGDGYPAARSSHDHHHNDDHDDHHDYHQSEHQRSLSQDYGLPSIASARNAPSTEYNAPNARTSQNSRAQKYAPPAARVSFTQRFRSSAPRSSSQDHSALAAKSVSQGYPNARSGISQEYGTPNTRSLSQEYGVPSISSARTLSTEYGMPDARSTPSQEYGAPVIAARSNQNSQSHISSFRSAQPSKGHSHEHSSPSGRSQFQTDSQSHSHNAPSSRSNVVSQGYDANSAFASRSAPSSTYGAPSSRSLSTSYSVPSARNSDSYSQEHDSVSQTYGAPSQRDLSDTYAAPNARSLSQEYGAPSARSDLETSAIASSYPSARTSPSSTYLPAARDAMPSQQYGVPEQDSNQGYEDARARALEELQNQEPANYDFAYQIEDQESGSDFGHTETRLENRAEGSYFVVLPDGTKQTVEYEADEGGFKPRISVEPVDLSARAGGYDENAADIARSAEGPY